MEKVLFFHQKNDFDGSTRVLTTLLENEYNNEIVSVVTYNIDSGFLTKLQNINYFEVFSKQSKHRCINCLYEIFRVLNGLFVAIRYSKKYDVFYINTILPYYAAIVGTLTRKKIIFHVHEKFVKKSLNERIAEFIFNHTKAKRIFVSRYLKDQYDNNINCESIIKYNTLPQSFIYNVKIRPIRERTFNTALMVTSLSEIKGLPMLKKLAIHMPNISFTLIANAYIEDIEAYYNHDVPHNLKLVPKQSDIQPYLFKTDLILNLSNPFFGVETFGMTILEAMPYGVPAIVPNVGGPTELIQNGYNGYCVDVNNLDEIANAINTILTQDNYVSFSKNTLIAYHHLYE